MFSPRLRSLLAATALAFTVAGCGRGLPGGGADVDLIREASQEDVRKLPADVTTLLPLAPGRVSPTRVVRVGGAVAGEVRVLGRRTMAGKSGIVLQSKRDGKVFRIELYEADPKAGLMLKGLGESAERLLTFDPPVPVLKPGMREGDGVMWTGTARMGKVQYAARAYHRINTIDKVRTPSGDYDAFRLDSIISVMAGQQRVDYPAVMWLKPGVGLVQRRLADRNRPVEEFLAARPR